MIGDCSVPLQDNIDWWVSNPVSRNTLNSDLFLAYCKVQLIKVLLESGNKINEIVVDTLAMKTILHQLPGINDTKITIAKSIIVSSLNNYGLLLLSMARQFVHKLFQVALFRILFMGKKVILTQPITLIDTFAIPGYYSRDRYYNGLWESLSKSEKNGIKFVPTIVMTSLYKLFHAFKELINAERQFLFKESYLKFSDIFYALLYPIRVRFIKIKSVVVDGIDYSSLINTELHNRAGYHLAIEGLINYRFIKRLKDKNIKIRKFIDWWESHSLDKGLHKALNKYFPDVPVVGYLGYAPRELELQLYPADYELYNNVVPEKIAVIGKAFVDGLKIFSPNHDIEYAPAFRFQHLWNGEPHKPDSNKYTVLIALPIILNDSIHIIKMVNSCLNDLSINTLRIWVKPHPTISVDQLKNELSTEWPNIFEICEDDTQLALRKSDILISGMSSICLEAMALGIPALVVEQPYGLQFVPVPDDIPQDLWKLCYSKRDILKSIEHFKSRNENELIRHANLGNEIREKCFEPVNRQGILKFLNINGEEIIA